MKEINQKAAEFLKNSFMYSLNEEFGTMLNEEFGLFIDENDPQTVCFKYPQVFEDEYILKVIRLEAGALTAWTPASNVSVEPFISEKFRNRMKQPSVNVLTVAPERTFWEKATILHKEAFRESGSFPERYSRHFYDLYKMYHSPVKDLAYKDMGLLKQVVDFKSKFYRSKSARYDLAQPTTMKLVPSKEYFKVVGEDYKAMSGMIYGAIPEFEEIMDCISAMEKEINMMG